MYAWGKRERKLFNKSDENCNFDNMNLYVTLDGLLYISLKL